MIGLKENVIIGKLIPVGTGMRQYRDVKIKSAAEIEAENAAATEEIIDEVIEEVIAEGIPAEASVEE